MNSAGFKKGFTPHLLKSEPFPLKRGAGFTTGTCAQAAVKGACIMLTKHKTLKNVEVLTPSGVKLCIGIIDQKIGKNLASCAVIKDSGDDPDVTNGAKICAEARFSNTEGITIKGAKGVGKVTKPGLAIAIGEWAINPVPRKIIQEEASRFLSGKNKGLEITISVPAGEEIAKRTFNPKLGIVGGISIIGTTGIVEPKSLDAYKAALTLQLDVFKAQGYKKVIFVLGYVGEKFCKERLNTKEDSVIKIGDHIGFMLKECSRKKIKEALLIGHIGKLIKVTNGQFNTHCEYGDKRLESIARYAKSCNADNDTIKKILSQKTTEAAIPILKESGLAKVFDYIAKDVAQKSEAFVNPVRNLRLPNNRGISNGVNNKLIVNCVLLSLNGELLAKTDEL